MYVCLCKAIAEQQIRDLIAQGVCQVRDVQRACSAGSDCGTCIATIKRMLHDGSVSLENAPTTCHPNKNIK
ncbi:MAG: (2Fe-2S)-binding protein [Oligoflexus sp.]